MKKTYIAILVALLMTVGGGGAKPEHFRVITKNQ